MSWDELLSISRERAALYREDRAHPPEACPNDGEPLINGPHGQLHCPVDGWEPDGTWP
jgi:hypothetical protein